MPLPTHRRRPFLRTHGASLIALVLFLSVNAAGAVSSAMLHMQEGEAMHPFTLPDTTGEAFDSASLAGKSSCIIFWSTWSPRSAEVLEDFKKYHEEYAPKGLTIVAVNIEGENLSATKKGEIRSYLERMNLPFTVLLDENLKVFADYGVVAHPTTMLVDAGGKAVFILSGYPTSERLELKERIMKLLGLAVPVHQEPAAVLGYVPKGGALMHCNLGKQLMERGQLDKALDYFDKAMDRDPDYMEPVIAGARILLLNSRADEAGQRLAKVTGPAAQREDVRFALGYTLLLQGKPDEAEASFSALTEKDPTHGPGWWGLGLVAFSRGDSAKALELMEKAHGLAPGNTEAEAYIHAAAKKKWIAGEPVPDEDRLVALFPSLTEARKRFQLMRGVEGAPPQP